MKGNSAMLLCISALLTISACQKEPDPSILKEPIVECQLIKAIEFDENGAQEDTAGYTYTSNKITRIDRIDYYNTLEYSGNKVNRRNYIDRAATNNTTYDIISYNADGNPSKVDFFISLPGLPTPILLVAYEFKYTGGKLTGFSEKVDTSLLGQPPVELFNYQYLYTGNNITKVIETETGSGLKDTLIYEYNNTANYYKSVDNVFFTDVLFNGLNGQTIPFAISSNNPTAVMVGSDNYLVSYTLDNNKNMSELLIDGAPAAKYYYLCK